jgi:uncharacterized protein YlzI (FlbEa/FlbD family)
MMDLLVGTFLMAASPSAQTPEVYTVQGDDAIIAKGRGVKFTRPDGSPVYLNPHTVAFVREALPTESGKTTIVFASGAKQAVMETIEEVIANIHIDEPGQTPP